MIKNIIFDFGAVLVDWNPHYVFDPYFGDRSRADWFLEHICNGEWNGQMDAGKPFDQGVAELSTRHPEWAAEIRLYRDRWTDMMGEGIPGMYDLVKELKDKEFRLYGLSNWSAETFYRIEGDYPVFSLLDGKVISGDVHLIKPDIRIFRLLLEKFGLKPEECVFIDDNAANVAASEAAGIRAIRFVDAAQLREALYRISV
ncbi:MAG: HAD family phosphatase [Bacteroidales bacterium]|nr:HAD family phosphatase [Bacteroidales bacterium]